MPNQNGNELVDLISYDNIVSVESSLDQSKLDSRFDLKIKFNHF